MTETQTTIGEEERIIRLYREHQAIKRNINRLYERKKLIEKMLNI